MLDRGGCMAGTKVRLTGVEQKRGWKKGQDDQQEWSMAETKVCLTGVIAWLE